MEDKSLFQRLKEAPIWGKRQSAAFMGTHIMIQRNLASSPFPPKFKGEASKEVLSLLKLSLLHAKTLEQPEYFPLSTLQAVEREFLMEHFLIPLETPYPDCHSAVILDQTGTFLALINGEDHLSLHFIDRALDWKEGWKRLNLLEEELSTQHHFAFSKRFGYLTSSLASAGTGLTLQAFLHLPLLIQLSQSDASLESALEGEILMSGLTGSDEFVGDLVILQNRYTIGLSEEHILEEVHRAAHLLLNKEEALRLKYQQQPPPQLLDKMSRALGLLRHSLLIETLEALKALSFIKLGIDLKLIHGLQDQEINALFFEMRRAHLLLDSKRPLGKEKLAQKRAEFLQSRLKELKFTP